MQTKLSYNFNGAGSKFVTCFDIIMTPSKFSEFLSNDYIGNKAKLGLTIGVSGDPISAPLLGQHNIDTSTNI